MGFVDYMKASFNAGFNWGEERRHKGFVEAIMALIMVVIFALIGYALLPTIANSSEAAALNANVTTAGSAVTRLGPMLVAVSILLAILGAGFGIMAIFRR